MRSTALKVKLEAIYCIANSICFIEDARLIRELIRNNEIDSYLMNYLKEGTHMKSVQVILHMYN